jgi:hypothetical protein
MTIGTSRSSCIAIMSSGISDEYRFLAAIFLILEHTAAFPSITYSFILDKKQNVS